jgi:hypothetical protein
MWRQLLNKPVEILLQVLHIRVLRRFVELLKVMHNLANDAGH